MRGIQDTDVSIQPQDARLDLFFYKISAAMLTAMRSADSLTESRARCV